MGVSSTGQFSNYTSQNFQWGLGAYFIQQVQNSPILIGIDINYAVIDRQQHVDQQNHFEHSSSSNSLNISAITRISPFKASFIRPYLDIKVGWRRIENISDFRFNLVDIPPHKEVITNQDNGLGYTIGIGAAVSLNTKCSINLGCNFNGSSQMNYLNNQNIGNKTDPTQGWDDYWQSLLDDGFEDHIVSTPINYFSPYIQFVFQIGGGPSTKNNL
ncbi:hypothetical protein [Flammeovirga sp. SubArs3]|uniref:hypothetical protein n=1 Tax=Flammeovirga sp. SubArs3 TaxID=2995316 RepID=UPI00248CA8D7|nr:hypothetical protein [Flammeovirga sp. SubArs3]